MDGYNTDKAVKVRGEDFFHRYDFAKRIADSIKELKKPDCLVIGINGAWGEGKSSILNFIENELEVDSNIIHFKFNPWVLNDETLLLSSLFNSIAKKLKESINDKDKKKIFEKNFFIKNNNDLLKREIENIGGLLQDYGELASVFGFGEALKKLGESISNVDIEEKKERIEQLLKKINKRIVVFIDDIDRLDKDEIYAILKIVKLTADLNYLVYIMSFDDKMVASAISERFGNFNNLEGNKFLEKIIQVSLKIPNVNKNDLKDYSMKMIDEVLNENEVIIEEKELRRFNRIFDIYFLDLIEIPRIIIRYVNSIRFAIPILKKNVNIVDFILIEAVQLFYPELYRYIYYKVLLFIEKYSDNINSNDLQKSIDTFFGDMMKSLNFDNCDCEEGKVIKALLVELFPQFHPKQKFSVEDIQEWNSNKRIFSHNYFSNYFSYHN